MNNIVIIAGLVACLILALFVQIFLNTNIVYSHFFYIPIIICGLRYYKKAVYLAGFLSVAHIVIDYFSSNIFSITPVLRGAIFVIIAFIVGTLSEKKDRLSMQLKKINNAMLDFVCEVNHLGNIGYISPSVKHTLGYDASCLMGKSFFELIHPEDKERVSAEFFHAVKMKSTIRFDYRYLNYLGEYVWLESLANFLDTKGPLILYVFGSRDITYRKYIEDKLEYISYHDNATGLYNWRYFQAELQRMRNADYSIGIIVCDGDGLKVINDNFGHQCGDEVILKIAQVLKSTMRENDIVARIGGDEFAVIMPRCSYPEAVCLYEKFKCKINDCFVTTDGITIPVFVSVGLAVREDRLISLDKLFTEADNNMYIDKNNNAQHKIVLSKIACQKNSQQTK